MFLGLPAGWKRPARNAGQAGIRSDQVMARPGHAGPRIAMSPANERVTGPVNGRRAGDQPGDTAAKGGHEILGCKGRHRSGSREVDVTEPHRSAIFDDLDMDRAHRAPGPHDDNIRRTHGTADAAVRANPVSRGSGRGPEVLLTGQGGRGRMVCAPAHGRLGQNPGFARLPLSVRVRRIDAGKR